VARRLGNTGLDSGIFSTPEILVMLLCFGCLEVGRDNFSTPEDLNDFCQKSIVDMLHMKVKQEMLDILIEPSTTLAVLTEVFLFSQH
jgi:hypothetical protein